MKKRTFSRHTHPRRTHPLVFVLVSASIASLILGAGWALAIGGYRAMLAYGIASGITSFGFLIILGLEAYKNKRG